MSLPEFAGVYNETLNQKLLKLLKILRNFFFLAITLLPLSGLAATQIITLENGDRYEGEIKDSILNGQGLYIWANGDRYEGEFLND